MSIQKYYFSGFEFKNSESSRMIQVTVHDVSPWQFSLAHHTNQSINQKERENVLDRMTLLFVHLPNDILHE